MEKHKSAINYTGLVLPSLEIKGLDSLKRLNEEYLMLDQLTVVVFTSGGNIALFMILGVEVQQILYLQSARIVMSVFP